MKKNSESNGDYMKRINFAVFSPTFSNIIHIFNDLIKIMQQPEKKTGEDLIREQKGPKIQNSPEKCPFCSIEGYLEIDNNSLKYEVN